VPKGTNENLEFRRKLLRRADGSASYRRDLVDLCRADPLFYLNAFCWTYDPRRPGSKVVPFISWPFQDEAILELAAAVREGRDVLIEKSRDMGGSWLCLFVPEWLWHFRPMQSFLLVSRKEEYVDGGDDPKTLFWKIDFLHKHQPRWLLPGINRTHMRRVNEDNGSTLVGESTNTNLGRGARLTAVLVDEFAAFEEKSYPVVAALMDSTNCRIWNSTPRGTDNAFYDLAHNPSITKIRLHWSQHPEKAKGLYHDENGKARSPWYDRKCKEVGHPQIIAQELDIDYLGSNFQFFDATALDAVEKRDCRPAYAQGELEFTTDGVQPVRFVPREGGRFRLWFYPEANGGKPPEGEYAAGADIAAGTGASNSCLVVGNRHTGEKVLEFVDSNVRPEAFAALSVATCRWFRSRRGAGAFLTWEATGPGRNYGDRVIEVGYRDVFYRKNETSLSKSQSDTPGWWPTPDNKRAVLGEYREALGTKFVNRSREAVRECREYVYKPGSDTVEHARASGGIDPSGARTNHGDRVIADALCFKGMKEQGGVGQKEAALKADPPPGSLAWRRKAIAERQQRREAWE
jgi:hypothetical protein